MGLDGSVLVGSDDGRLYGLDPSNGRARWEFQTGGPVRASAIVDGAGRIFVGSQDRFIYCLSPRGSLLWQHRMRGEVDSSGAIGPDGVYYTGCDDGGLYALASTASGRHPPR